MAESGLARAANSAQELVIGTVTLVNTHTWGIVA